MLSGQLETEGHGPVHIPGEAGVEMSVVSANKVSFRAILGQVSFKWQGCLVRGISATLELQPGEKENSQRIG